MLKQFLMQVSYDVKETDEKDQLTLSTIHQSKGLEWPLGTSLNFVINPRRKTLLFCSNFGAYE